jgi:hypothetical protein
MAIAIITKLGCKSAEMDLGLMPCDGGISRRIMSTTEWHSGQADSIQLTVAGFYEM